jgi:hypothetical protein
MALALAAITAQADDGKETKVKQPQKVITELKPVPTTKPDDRALATDKAAESSRSGKVVTVEFVVARSHPLLPGDYYRLYSTELFQDDKAFIVQFETEAALKMLGVKRPEKPFVSRNDYFELIERHFTDARIRVQGQVQQMHFSSTPKTAPGIHVDDPATVQIIPRDVPPVMAMAVINGTVAKKAIDMTEWGIELTLPVARWETVGEMIPKSEWPSLKADVEMATLNIPMGGPPSQLIGSRVVDQQGVAQRLVSTG